MNDNTPNVLWKMIRFLIDGRISRYAWLPIPFFLAAMAVLWAADLRTFHESRLVLLALNFLFTTLISLLVIVLVGRSFLARGTSALLMLGCGMLLWGSAGTVAPALRPYGVNVAITVHNVLIWLAALCQLSGVLLSMKPRRTSRLPSVVLAMAYTGALCLAWLVIKLTLEGWMPVFFVQGHGGTLIRSFILGSSAIMFGLTTAVLWQTNRRSPSAFVHWYGSGLLLVATGLLGVMIEPVMGGWLSWMGRAVQYLGGAYILVAAIASVRESGLAGISLSTALRMAQQNFRTLVDMSPDAIIVHSDGKFVFVNPAAIRLFGATKPEDIVGREVLSLTHSDDHEIVATRMRLVAQEGRNTPARVIRVLRLDGQAVDVETTGARIEFQGRPAVQAILRDVTEIKRAESVLQASEAKYRALAENSPDVIDRFDRSFRHLYVNPAGARLHGVPAEAIIGKTIVETGVLEPYRSLWEERIRKAFEEGREAEVEDEFPTPEGKGSFHSRIIPELAADGSVASVLVVSRDITARKQAEKSLAQNRDLLDSTQRLAKIGGWNYDVATDCVAWTNEVYRIYGVSPDMFDPNDFPVASVFLPPGGRDRIDKAFRDAMEQGISYDLELDLISADGRHIWVRTMGQPVYQEGRVVRVFGNIIDITELHEARAALEEANRELEERVAKRTAALKNANEGMLREMENRRLVESELVASEERYRTLMNATPDFIYSLDREGRYTAANRAVCTALGLPENQIIGRTDAELGFPEDVVREWKDLHRQVLNGETVHTETVTPTPKGGWCTYDIVFYPILGPDGMVTGIRGISRDITGQRQVEEQLIQAQKLEAIGILAGGVAHDFNNILMGINGYASLVLNMLSDDDPLRQYMAEIKGGSERAAKLTQQLLAFSRKQPLQPEVVNLNEVILNLTKMLKPMIGEDIGFVMALDNNLGQTMADSGQMEQVVMNLAVNARDAMPQGGKLVIETANVEFDQLYANAHPGVALGPHIMLAVTDSGCGMDEHTKSRIFEPFFTTKTKGKGTGLGLATVYGIVKQSGGSIVVDSEPGQGTTFKIFLPRVENKAPKREKKEVRVLRGKGELVLVAEDEMIVRSLLGKNLTSLGYLPKTTANGEEALLAVEKEGLRPDLLITDVVMPGMSGVVLANRLRKTMPDLKVLYISGYTDDAIVHHGVLDSGTHFLQKPFATATLAHKIREVLEEK